jgi:hypothetical protein
MGELLLHRLMVPRERRAELDGETLRPLPSRGLTGGILRGRLAALTRYRGAHLAPGVNSPFFLFSK